jgi:hypothetical protein
MEDDAVDEATQADAEHQSRQQVPSPQRVHAGPSTRSRLG